MRKLNKSLLAGLAVTSLLYVSVAGADDERHRVKATLSGFQETRRRSPSPGSGSSRRRSTERCPDHRLQAELRGLEAAAIAAHIHLGARGTPAVSAPFSAAGQ